MNPYRVAKSTDHAIRTQARLHFQMRWFMRKLFICLSLAILALPLRAGAIVVDYYLELPGIAGEASAPGHSGLLDIVSFSSSPPGEASFVTPTSGATPSLLSAIASGTVFPVANFYAYTAPGPDQSLLYEITFSNTLLTSLQNVGLYDQLGLQFRTSTLTCHDADFCADPDNGVPGRVPEPATLTLLGVGIAGLGFARRRRDACHSGAQAHILFPSAPHLPRSRRRFGGLNQPSASWQAR